MWAKVAASNGVSANKPQKIVLITPPWYRAANRTTVSSERHTLCHSLHTREAATKVVGPMVPLKMCVTRSALDMTFAMASMKLMRRAEGATVRISGCSCLLLVSLTLSTPALTSQNLHASQSLAMHAPVLLVSADALRGAPVHVQPPSANPKSIACTLILPHTHITHTRALMTVT